MWSASATLHRSQLTSLPPWRLLPALQNYTVVPEMPLYFNVGALMLGTQSGEGGRE
jgi:hypothetical protein